MRFYRPWFKIQYPQYQPVFHFLDWVLGETPVTYFPAIFAKIYNHPVRLFMGPGLQFYLDYPPYTYIQLGE